MSILSRLKLTKESLYFISRNIFNISFRDISKVELVQKAYKGNPFVFMVVDKIASLTSRLPYVFVNSSNDIIEDSDEENLWKQPQKGLYGSEFRKEILTDLEVTGEAFVLGHKSVGFGEKYQEFEVLPSRSVFINYTNNSKTEVSHYELTQGNKTERIYNVEDVLHIKFQNITEDGKSGLSPLQAAYSVVSASTSIFQSEDSIFKNRGVNEILTNDSDMPILSKEREGLQENFQNQTAGTDKFGQIMITNAKLRNLKLGMSPSDLKLLESSINKLRVISSVYGLDSSLFNDPENKTYSNRAEAQKAAYNDVYIPLAENEIIKTFNKWWLQDNWKSQLRLSIDKKNIEVLREVNSDLSAKIINEINAGIITQEEGKELLYGNNN